MNMNVLTSAFRRPTAIRRRVQTRRASLIRVIAGVLPTILLFLASFLPFAFSPIAPDAAAVLLPPDAVHWFGTDASGFDVFSRTFTAARLDLPLAVGGTIAAALIGVPIGLLASEESVASNAVMRVVDALQALPLLIVAIAIVSLSGRNIFMVILAIVLVAGPNFVRLTRSGAIVVRSTRFVEAAASLGASRSRVMFVHILPNVAGLVLAQFVLAIGMALVVIAALNFIGVGVTPPTPSWGSMISAGAGVIGQGAWWVAFFPSLAIVLVVSSLSFAARNVEELLKAR